MGNHQKANSEKKVRFVSRETFKAGAQGGTQKVSSIIIQDFEQMLSFLPKV